MKAPVGCAPYSKLTRDHTVVKLVKHAAKLDDGRIWNLNRIVQVGACGRDKETSPEGQSDEHLSQKEKVQPQQDEEDTELPDPLRGNCPPKEGGKGIVSRRLDLLAHTRMSSRMIQAPRHLMDYYC